MKMYFESRRDKKLNLHKNVGSRIYEEFKFKSGDTAYTMVYSSDNGKRAVYEPVKIKDAWFDDAYGNQYSFIHKDGSINSSCPEEFLLTEYELQKELDSGSKLVENNKRMNEDLVDNLKLKLGYDLNLLRNKYGIKIDMETFHYPNSGRTEVFFKLISDAKGISSGEMLEVVSILNELSTACIKDLRNY